MSGIQVFTVFKLPGFCACTGGFGWHSSPPGASLRWARVRLSMAVGLGRNDSMSESIASIVIALRTYLIGYLRPCWRAGSSDRGGHCRDLFLGGFQKCGNGLGRMHALQVFVLLKKLAGGDQSFPLLLGKVIGGYSASEASFSFSLRTSIY